MSLPVIPPEFPILAAPSQELPEQVFISHSVEDTLAWAQKLGATMQAPLTVLLTGSLGAGKTVVVRGLALGLQLQDGWEVNSPSYTLMNVYPGRCRIYHLDLYRLSSERDLENIGLFDLLEDEQSVVLIEWGEWARRWIPHGWHMRIQDEGGDQRRISCSIF